MAIIWLQLSGRFWRPPWRKQIQNLQIRKRLLLRITEVQFHKHREQRVALRTVRMEMQLHQTTVMQM